MRDKLDLFGIVIGTAVMGLAIAVIVGLFLIAIPDSNQEAAMLALGIVLGWGGSIVNWRFGSSHGSDRKTDLLNERPKGTSVDPVHVEEEK